MLLVCLLPLMEAVSASQVSTLPVDKVAAAVLDSRGTVFALQRSRRKLLQAQTAKQLIRKKVRREGRGGAERKGRMAAREGLRQQPATMDCDDWHGTDFMKVMHQFAGCQEFARRLNARIGNGQFFCGAQEASGRSLLKFRIKADQTKFADWLERTLSIPKTAVHIFDTKPGSDGLMYWSCGSRSDSNNNLNKLNNAIKANVCKCDHGVVAQACTQDGANECSSCTGAYHLSAKTCKANICTCQSGTKAVGTACTGNGLQICTTCDKGYHLSAKTCKANVCTCQGGTKAAGDACTGNGLHICTACDKGYHMKDKRCSANLCTCKAGGTPATGTNCTSDEAEICATCTAGYHKADKSCVANECSCPNGIAANGTSCTNDKAVTCSECTAGHKLVNATCESSAKSFGPLLWLPAMLAFWTML